MNRKEELISHLEEKINRESYAFAERELKASNTPFYQGETEYTREQKEHFLIRAERGKILPREIQILENILYGVTHVPNPSTVSNANSNDEAFPAYRFLLHLLEPASKYFNGSDGISVIEHLVLQEDTDCPKGSSGLQSEEGLEIYLGTKEQAILNLKEAFENRGVRKDFKDYTEESISHSITNSRFNYLTKLCECFEKNPSSQEVINFVLDLPSNTWFDEEISFGCDGEEIEKLREKYVKGYKKEKIIRDANRKLGDAYDLFLDAKLTENGVSPLEEGAYSFDQRRRMHAEIQEIPDSIRIKHNLLEKISKKTFILGAGYDFDSECSESNEIPF